MSTFGVRDVCDVVLKSIKNTPACKSLTGKDIAKGEPVCYFDSLKVSTLSGSATTVYATGGAGNNRRLAWDGDREVTFHMEDALLTPESFAIMTSAKLKQYETTNVEVTSFGSVTDNGTDTVISLNLSTTDANRFVEVVSITSDGDEVNLADVSFVKSGGITITVANDTSVALGLEKIVYKKANIAPITVHSADTYTVNTDGIVTLPFLPVVSANYPMFVYILDDLGNRGSKIAVGTPTATADGAELANPAFTLGSKVLIDTYKQTTGAFDRLVLTADATSDYYRLEGSTVFYREADGEPMPAYLTIFKIKPRTTFELSMSSTGDPSSFSMDFDAFPEKGVAGFEKCKNGIFYVLDIEYDAEDDCDCTYEA